MKFRFSFYQLSDVEKSVLCKDLNFSVKSKSIEYSEFLLPFELLFRDVKQENLYSEDLSLMKATLLDTALSSYENFSSDRSPSKNLSASEFKALKVQSCKLKKHWWMIAYVFQKYPENFAFQQFKNLQ